MSNTNPLVSIVIPVYNGSNYLKDAIDSALAQTYKNIEIIVVNDGSNDNGKTERIARSYGKKIRYFKKNNGGVASAINFGIKKMKGEWFIWLSHDDRISSDRLETDLAALGNNYLVSFTDIHSIDGNNNIINKITYNKRVIDSAVDCWEANGLHMCSMTISSRCIEHIGYLDENNLYSQDVEFTLKLSSLYPIIHNPVGKTFVRMHAESGTYQKLSKRTGNNKYLASVIKRDLSIEGFFPNYAQMNRLEKSKAQNWMGEFYRVLEEYPEAIKCYRASYALSPSIKLLVKKSFGPKFITLISKVYS